MSSDFPDSVCQRPTCVFTPHSKRRIDLSLSPLTDASSSRNCSNAAGGMLPVTEDVEFSFIMAVTSDFQRASENMLEIFLTSKEVRSAEFILVGDGPYSSGSHDDEMMRRLVAELKGTFGVNAIYLPSVASVGLPKTYNRGAEVAGGKYLVFLNSDVTVLTGWLAPLAKTFSLFDNVGAVGPMFIGHNARVVESGVVIFNDASGAWVGYGDEPSRYDLLFARDVDYVSAAVLAVRTRVFNAVKGFDLRFTPGYYEDTDLALSIRASGFRTMVQPLSVVMHSPGSTFGRKTANLEAENKIKFLSKWNWTLRSHCNKSTASSTAMRRSLGPSVLWIEDRLPVPDRDSGSIRHISLMSHLTKRGVSIRLYALHEEPADDSRSRIELGLRGIEVLPYFGFMADDLKLILTECEKMDAIIVSRKTILSVVAKIIRDLCPNVRLVFDTVDVHFLRESRGAIVTAEGMIPEKERFLTPSLESVLSSVDERTKMSIKSGFEEEIGLMTMADAILVVSHIERDILSGPLCNIAWPKISVVSNVHDPVRSSVDAAKRTGILFTGNMQHGPNFDSLKIIVEVLLTKLEGIFSEHALQSAFTSLTVHVVSGGGNGIIQTSNISTHPQWANHVKFHGRVSDGYLENLYDTSRVVVAPLRFGAGVKGKVGGALARGSPIVMTSVASEGMNLTDGIDCLIRDDWDDFAEAIYGLYTDNGVWTRISAAALETASKTFSSEVVGSILHTVLELPNSGGNGRGTEASAGTHSRNCETLPIYPKLPSRRCTDEEIRCYGLLRTQIDAVYGRDVAGLREHFYEHGVFEGAKCCCPGNPNCFP